ncbi:MAG TPA: 2OG-Fe dioxygenase family protein [Acetobacteraceae bacterium]|nr:2OG-Fe dioxygenase family protein [Acetobacteraceae bacterium]
MNKPEPLTETIREAGFAFVHAGEMRPALEQAGSLADWNAFAASWDDLGLDTYMADGGRYRKRRFAVFGTRAADAAITPKPHQPHYQSRDYNTLNGGIERWFSPIQPEIAEGATLSTILRWCRRLFDSLSGPQDWHIELHQFRIEARRGVEGRPTPEGRHRDGVDHVLVLLVGRRNIQSGVTTIHDLDGRMLGSFTLTEPLDAALVDDRRVLHGVTPVEPVDPRVPGFRDVLVVTFRREAAA